MCQDFNNV